MVSSINPNTLNVLLLGGTADAKQLAIQLHSANLHYYDKLCLTYSLVGLLRQPDLPCSIICGGFSQYGGLINYLSEQAIDVLVDATHPYAAKMSHEAYHAAQVLQRPYWRYTRPMWGAEQHDQWQTVSFAQVSCVIQQHHYQRIFLSIGQSATPLLEKLLPTYPDKLFLLRTAGDLAPSLAAYRHLIHEQQIGGFTPVSETQLLQRYRIDCLVSKNSGGQSGLAKLQAARALHLPVLMLERPALPLAEREFFCQAELVAAIKHFSG
ncbi:MAG: precorrin-6A/cobalt-precorrin-6A reductase [bacterium]